MEELFEAWPLADRQGAHADGAAGVELKSWASEQARFDNCMLELEELSLSQFCDANEAENLQRLQNQIADFERTSLKRKFNSPDDASAEVNDHVQENIDYTLMWQSYTDAMQEHSQQFYLQLKQKALDTQKLNWQTKNGQLHEALSEILDWQCSAMQDSLAKKSWCRKELVELQQNINRIGNLAAKRIHDSQHAATSLVEFPVDVAGQDDLML